MTKNMEYKGSVRELTKYSQLKDGLPVSFKYDGHHLSGHIFGGGHGIYYVVYPGYSANIKLCNYAEDREEWSPKVTQLAALQPVLEGDYIVNERGDIAAVLAVSTQGFCLSFFDNQEIGRAWTTFNTVDELGLKVFSDLKEAEEYAKEEHDDEDGAGGLESFLSGLTDAITTALKTEPKKGRLRSERDGSITVEIVRKK